VLEGERPPTLQLIFERDGYKVTSAYSCAEALQLLRDGHRADTIITDLNMNGKTRLRSGSPGAADAAPPPGGHLHRIC
jgi:CheY-like chemotaxis protein